MLYNIISHYFDDAEHAISYPKAHITTSEGHAVDATGIVMIAGTRVLGQHLTESLEVGGAVAACHGIGNVDLQRLPLMAVDEARASLGVGIGIGHVGLDVVDGRAVHEVGTEHMDDRTLGGVELHLIYTYAREPEVVGTEGRARGKNPDAIVAA